MVRTGKVCDDGDRPNVDSEFEWEEDIMESTLAMTAKEHTTGFNAARRNSAGRLILRMGLGGLALLLWQAAPVKAQECCPDQSTAAELARFESASKKSAKMETAKMQQSNSAASVKMGTGAATGTNAAGNRKSKTYSKPPAIKEALLGVETSVSGKPGQKAEARSDGDAQKKADGQGGAAGR